MARDAAPAFQPDRRGSPGFQLAQNAGLQTQTPRWAGTLASTSYIEGCQAAQQGK